MPIAFTVSAVVPASPREVYDAWLSSDGHTRMTGSPAHATAQAGAAFDAWDGYIRGTNLELEPGRRIVQSWRTSKFEGSMPDSRLEIALEAVPGGTRVTLTHSNVPDGHTTYESGWVSHYFQPMKRYFAAGKRAPAAVAAPKKKAAAKRRRPAKRRARPAARRRAKPKRRIKAKAARRGKTRRRRARPSPKSRGRRTRRRARRR